MEIENIVIIAVSLLIAMPVIGFLGLFVLAILGGISDENENL